MRIRPLEIWALVTVLSAPVFVQGEVKRGAGRGAAMGAIWGLILGGDLDSAARGAAAGAATGAVGGAFAKQDRKRRQEQIELQRLRQQEMRELQEERALQAEAERLALERERTELARQRRELEEQVERARQAEDGSSYYPQTEEEWIAAIGRDNYSALDALVDCQYQRADLLAQAGATSESSDYQLASRWVQALVALDRQDTARTRELYEELVIFDRDFDSVQQVSLEADAALLDLRQLRREEGISCRD